MTTTAPSSIALPAALFRLLGLVALLAAIVLSLQPSSAFAHAEPAKVSPGDGAVVTSPPAQIRVQTTQDMARQADRNTLVVVDANGSRVTPVAAQIDNTDRRLLTVPVPATIPPGTYTVQWTTLSADDGDTASGEWSFTYDPSGTASPGKEQLVEDVLGGSPTATATAPGSVATATGTPDSVSSVNTAGGGGTSWVLVGAVAIGMFVLGGGSMFLFVQRRP